MRAVSGPMAIESVDARGVRHRPVAADGPAHALMLERPETRRYGNH